MDTIFCNIGWLRYYNGEKYLDEYEKPLNGGSFNELNVGNEILNFKQFSGNCYGYVQPPGGGSVLHHDTNLGKEFNSNGYIDHVRVIWIANAKNTQFGKGTRIIGWYNDARAYAEYQTKPFNEKTGYYFSAKAEDCVLLSEKDRTFNFAKNIRNTWYVSDENKLTNKDRLLFSDCIDYVQHFSENIGSGTANQTNSLLQKIYFEGMVEHINIERKTRNSVVVARAKEEFACSHNGSLFCEVCGFDYYKRYGDIGFGFIEAHHIFPFAKRKEGIVKSEDFRMVCANCHRMLHREEELTVEKLQAIIASVRERNNF